jgi:DNA-binding LacI/PurR family transcriptional regulator
MARKAQEINIYRIAEEAGVSVPTVSKVINQKAGVTEQTRNKVNALLELYNFRPVYTKTRTTRIAVIYPWPSFSDYFSKAMQGIFNYTENNELTVSIIIAQSRRKESLLEAVRDQQCAGVVALLSDEYRKDLEVFSNTNLPVVVVDSTTDHDGFGFIDNDSFAGSSEAAKHLIDLGHRAVGYLTYAKPAFNQSQRFKGARQAFNRSGICLPDENIVASTDTSPVRGQNGFNAMNQLLRQSPSVTAVMACDDAMALGAMAACHKAGLRIPGDISVIGFDNYPETEFSTPALTTVDHQIEKASAMATEVIHRRLKIPRENWTPLKEILSTHLVIRESTGRAILK